MNKLPKNRIKDAIQNTKQLNKLREGYANAISKASLIDNFISNNDVQEVNLSNMITNASNSSLPEFVTANNLNEYVLKTQDILSKSRLIKNSTYVHVGDVEYKVSVNCSKTNEVEYKCFARVISAKPDVTQILNIENSFSDGKIKVMWKNKELNFFNSTSAYIHISKASIYINSRIYTVDNLKIILPPNSSSSSGVYISQFNVPNRWKLVVNLLVCLHMTIRI